MRRVEEVLMTEDLERGVHRAVGMSDMASLLTVALRFPESEDLSAALNDGAFLSDWADSWLDACDGAEFDPGVVERCGASFARADHVSLRREYSRLFLAPGLDVPVWSYESCFLHRASDAEGVPSLFRTRVALDVEKQMAEAGVKSSTARTEPVDAVHKEFEFLAYLYAQWGEALRRADAGEFVDESDVIWAGRIVSFATGHVLKWLPDFMQQVKEQSRLDAYCAFADLGLLYLEEVEKDVRVFSAEKAVAS